MAGTISNPLSWVAFLFLDHENQSSFFSDQKALGANLNQFLVQQRFQRRFIDRKANLLVRPFSMADGGYLPGYLFIKQLVSWWQGSYFDPDVNLAFLR